MKLPTSGIAIRSGLSRRLADVAGGEAREAGAVGEQRLELLGRDQLRARLRVHVHELREQELDPLVGDGLAGHRQLLGELRTHTGCISHMSAPAMALAARIARRPYVDSTT